MIPLICCAVATSLLGVSGWCAARLQVHRRDYRTGLLTLRALHEFGRSRRGRHFGTVAWVDLNMFREVNKSEGHDFGDDLISAIGLSFRRVLTRADVGTRPGGDEFLVFSRRSQDGLRDAIESALAPVIVRNGKEARLCTVTAVIRVSTRGEREELRALIARMSAEARKEKTEWPKRQPPTIVPLGPTHAPLSRHG